VVTTFTRRTHGWGSIHREIKERIKAMKKKTRHEGDEGTIAFWLYMKALYKDND
tara:strand:- start:179 stop:340 length:162 start_codon:yes stop_codon:yes gene_type:complete